MDHEGSHPDPALGAKGVRANSGNIVGGDNFGIVASGHAQVTRISYGPKADDPLEMIDQLLHKLEAEASALGGNQAEDVIDDVRRLHTEVHSRKLSAQNIRAALSRLSAATTSTATMLATIDQIKNLVTALLH